jgi:hypothetical protein
MQHRGPGWIWDRNRPENEWLLRSITGAQWSAAL